MFEWFENEDAVLNQHIFKVVPDEKKVFKSYLKLILNQAIEGMLKYTHGSTMKHINRREFLETKIPLPPLKEQKRIAAILDKADALRRKRQQAIELTETFLRSVFLDMFGDPVTNPKGWDTKLFEELGSLDRGKSKHRPRNAPELLGGPYPLIQTGEIANSGGYIRKYSSTYSEIGLKQSKMWPISTLCITIAANIAKTGILTFEACFPDSVVGFTPNKTTTTEYIQYWLSFLQKILEEMAPESAQKNINLTILRALSVPLPPLGAQRNFSSIVARSQETIQKLKLSQLEFQALSDSLSENLFSESQPTNFETKDESHALQL